MNGSLEPISKLSERRRDKAKAGEKAECTRSLPLRGPAF
jgi:hypothetical protein